MLDEMITFYEKNEDFRRFVDKNAEQYRKTPMFVLRTVTTQEYYLSMQRGGVNEPKQQN